MPHFIVRALALCLLTLAGAASPAYASFGDCNSPAYLGLFDSRLASDRGFLCVESDRVAVSSEAGTTHIRIVQHLVADWARRPGAMRAIKNGVAAAAAAMGPLGRFRISDVTILLVDGFGPGGHSENFGDIAAWTAFAPGDECRITIWLLGPGATAAYGTSVVAHELFHCVERSSLTTAQLSSGAGTGGAGGTWWIEGAADWFATLAAPAPSYMRDRVAVFDRDSPTVALNQMSYDAFVFFAWLGGAAGPNRAMPFLHAMASSAGEGAQRAAMIAALPPDQWLRFAEDYADQKIRDGQGASIGSTPARGQTLEWNATVAKRVELVPFVLKRAELVLRCGRWTMAPRPDKFHAAKPDGATAWAGIPSSIDAMGSERKTFRFAGLAASASTVSLQIQGTLAARCEECAGTREIDRCLVGTWQVTTDGVATWYREHIRKSRITGISQEGNTLTLNADNTFSTGASRVGAATEGDDGMRGHGRLASTASGRWSAAGARFNLCPDAAAMNGTITVVKDGHAITIPFPARPVPLSSRAYSCSGTTLTLTTPIPGAGAVQSTYAKISSPAP